MGKLPTVALVAHHCGQDVFELRIPESKNRASTMSRILCMHSYQTPCVVVHAFQDVGVNGLDV